jgi:hypothetical protein
VLGEVVLCEHQLASPFDVMFFSAVGSERGECFKCIVVFLGPSLVVDMVPSLIFDAQRKVSLNW